MRMADTLFLDFEGEGRKGLDRVPQLPFLAGLYRPKARGRKSQFSVSLFREHCTPVKNGIPEISEITALETFITRITEQAEIEGLTIGYWSDHELKIVDDFLPELLEQFKAVSINVKVEADRYLNRQRQSAADSGEKALNAYLSAVCPEAAQVSAPTLGAAKSCARLERYSLKEKKWSRWTDKQKSVAKELVRYNREDCLATAKIMRKVLTSPARLKRDTKYRTKITSPGANE